MKKIQNKSGALRALYNFLKENVELSRWWPAETRFEIFIGVVLTQNTAWKNVEKSLFNLRREGLLEVRNLLTYPEEKLQELIRPSGFMRAKSACLKELGRAFFYHDDELRQMNYAELRARLLEIKGIGDESADTLCLYAYDKSCFIYDKYALRLLEICGLLDAGLKYRRAKSNFDDYFYSANFSLREEKALHGLIVDANKWSQFGAKAKTDLSLGEKSFLCSEFEEICSNLRENLEIADRAKRGLAEYLLRFV